MDRISDLETVLAAARKRIEGLEAALRLCIAWMPLAEVHSWPPGFRLRKEALAAATAALSSPAVTAEGKKLGEEGGGAQMAADALCDAFTNVRIRLENIVSMGQERGHAGLVEYTERLIRDAEGALCEYAALSHSAPKTPEGA